MAEVSAIDMTSVFAAVAQDHAGRPTGARRDDLESRLATQPT
jgi:hypothetical protein